MRNFLKNLDFWLYIIPTVLTVFGIVVIYSLVYARDGIGLIYTQAIALAIGLALMFFLSIYDYRQLKNIVWPIYIFSILLLLVVDIWGKSAGGATRWLELGFTQVQPSEIFKLVAIIFWSSYFSEKIGEIKWRDLLFFVIGLSLPLYLILSQPDLGTALVVSFIALITLFWLQLKKGQKIVLWLLLIIVPIVAYLAYQNYSFFGELLKDYQRDRVAVFLDPSKDVLGRGYNVKQAIIAVGSGGIIGKGLGQGTQSQLQFLPKAHTDFIFSGFAEAFGFVGCLVLVVGFFVLLIRIIRAANLAKDHFGLLISIGVAAMIFFQVVENIGMNIGILPVTGIPLPFLSYGGSSLVITFAALGVVQSIIVRHKKIIF